MHITTKLCLLGFVLILASCSDQKEDVTSAVNKQGAVETSVTVQHADSSHDVIKTVHKVWANSVEFKTVIHLDTIPSLGTEYTEGENANGDTKKVEVPKDYEIYITVK